MTQFQKGSRIPFTFTTDTEFENIVAYWVKSDNEKVLAKFAYPELADHATLNKIDALHYSGVLVSDYTKNETVGKLRLDIKTFVNDNYHPIGVASVTSIQSNSVGSIEKW